MRRFDRPEDDSFIYPLKRSGARDALRRLAVAAYAARSVLRRRLATASALIGLALGIAIASAPWVATDSTLRGLTDYYVGGVSIDLTASGSDRNVVNASVAAGGGPDGARAEPLVGVAMSGRRRSL